MRRVQLDPIGSIWKQKRRDEQKLECINSNTACLKGSGRIENACSGSAAAPKDLFENLGRLEGQKAILDDSFTF